MSLRRHILQVVALVTAVALVFGAFAGSATAKKMSKKQKAHVRAELRKQVKRNPGAVKRRSFLKKAALVNFKLPVTIRLRNTCLAASNPAGSASPGGVLTTPTLPPGSLPGQTNPLNTGGLNCAAQGTALNQRTVPSARVNLGPSLGSRDIGLAGALSAVVEFSDTYDGGALGNVNIKIIPDSSKGLKTTSVPLLWNEDITKGRADANSARANIQAGAPVVVNMQNSIAKNAGFPADPYGSYTAGGIAFANAYTAGGLLPGQQAGETVINYTIRVADGLQQGCGDYVTPATAPNQVPGVDSSLPGPGSGYNALFYGIASIGSGFGVPGYSVFNAGSGIGTNGGIVPVHPGIDNPTNIKAGNVVGDNEYIGPNPFPFPTQTAPSTTAGGAAPGAGTGTVGGSPATYGNAPDTVLRTNALSLDIAQGGQQVDMSTGTVAGSGLTTAQGSQNVTLGYSGGQANLFGNIPGKNVGIDVTVNLATKINSIARIMDQDVFKTPTLVQGENYPAGIFNCRQIVTGAVQNYIPGVRLTGSLRIAPAITKDGKVRIAKATVQSDTNNPDRVALSACLIPAKPYNDYIAGSDDSNAVALPSKAAIDADTANRNYVNGGSDSSGGIYARSNNAALPVDSNTRRWGYSFSAAKTGPDTTRCGTDTLSAPGGPDNPGMAEIIKLSGLTGQVVALNAPGSPYTAQAVGVQQSHTGAQASVAGDITVNPIDVDVLLGDVGNVN